MRCARCGAAGPEGMRFCEECGAPIGIPCPGCGASVSPGKHFCWSCGQSLSDAVGGDPAQSAAPVGSQRGEVKPVTALFCDIVGSTSLAERLGAEETHGLLDRFFTLAVGEVQRYGGSVNKFLGDGFLALVGVPRAQEDHARRAALLALDLRQRIGEEINEGNRPVGVRMGVNTGTAVVGSLGGGAQQDFTAVGDTTNVAARLQQIAQPGEILLSQTTARLVSGWVRLDLVGIRNLRGRARSVHVYRLVERTRRPVGSGAVERPSPFVGREGPAHTLEDALDRARQGQGQAVGVVAEAGLGKSRLLGEFRKRSGGRRCRFLEGRCVSYGTTSPYTPVVGIVRDACGLEGRENERTCRERLAATLQGTGSSDAQHLPFLLHLLGHPLEPGLGEVSSEAMRQRTLDAFRHMIVVLARRTPLVVTVEDLHWIDPTSEAVLDVLARDLHAEPILLLTTYRPGYRPPWSVLSVFEQISLRSLAEAEARAIVRATLGAESAGTNLEEVILARGEGNPLFLEELGRDALDSSRAGSISIPETVHGLLMARIDRLGDEPRHVLQCASVLGREFSARTLAAIWRGTGELDHHLAELCRSELLTERPGAGESRYVLRHALIQDAAYSSLLNRRRRALHEAAARALLDLHPSATHDVLSLVAYHFARTNLHDDAITYLRAAASLSAARHSHAEAAQMLEDAVVHAEALPPERRDRAAVEIATELAYSEYFLGRFPVTVERLEALSRRAARLRDPRVSGPYHFHLGLALSHIGDYGGAVRQAEEAASDATACGDDATVGRALILLCREALWTSRFEESAYFGTQALAHLSRADELWWQAQCQGWLILTFAQAGRFEEALASAAEQRRIGERLRDARLRSYASWAEGLARAMRGETGAGIRLAREGLELSPDPLNTAFATGVLGYAMEQSGDADGAALLDRAVEILKTFGVDRVAAWLEACLADALRLAGRLEQARLRAEAALVAARRLSFPYVEGIAIRATGRVAFTRGDLRQAQERLAESLSVLGRIGARHEAAVTHLDLASLDGDDSAPAAAHAARALTVFESEKAESWRRRADDVHRRLRHSDGGR